jgi:hypothetical protein
MSRARRTGWILIESLPNTNTEPGGDPPRTAAATLTDRSWAAPFVARPTAHDRLTNYLRATGWEARSEMVGRAACGTNPESGLGLPVPIVLTEGGPGLGADPAPHCRHRRHHYRDNR